ncbi:MAG: Type secretion system protein GspE [Parcubacteria group bacterium]|nr:Type secretion system protein GspE [Parcubacteria group bacterium]
MSTEHTPTPTFPQTESSKRVRDELKNELFISVTHLTDALVRDAHERGASDIHIDPEPESIRVRMRTDGLLENAYIFPKGIHAELIARLKILSGLRTDEHFVPQDGRFRFSLSDSSWIDIRISIAPTYYGENAVLRLLSSNAAQCTLEELGISIDDKRLVYQALSRSTGMIIVTGPTGSGKTTTLYTLMKILAEQNVSLVTIEDPIEYSMPGIRQMQANPQTGLTFAKGLRAMLRQDPDILMIGEIRDTETAGLAVNAALTGHLVLSTLHTSDAATTLPRLLDMHIEPYLIASTVRLVIAQRLVRRICKDCTYPIHLSPEERASFTNSESTEDDLPLIAYKGRGCAFCNESGYRGRVGIYELLPISAPIQEAINRRATAREVRAVAASLGIRSMDTDGLKKVADGETTIEEILRIRYE